MFKLKQYQLINCFPKLQFLRTLIICKYINECCKFIITYSFNTFIFSLTIRRICELFYSPLQPWLIFCMQVLIYYMYCIETFYNASHLPHLLYVNNQVWITLSCILCKLWLFSYLEILVLCASKLKVHISVLTWCMALTLYTTLPNYYTYVDYQVR